jgi:hypothetical protein
MGLTGAGLPPPEKYNPLTIILRRRSVVDDVEMGGDHDVTHLRVLYQAGDAHVQHEFGRGFPGEDDRGVPYPRADLTRDDEETVSLETAVVGIFE